MLEHKVIIGISGKKGTGKDTVAEYLKRKISTCTMNDIKLDTSIISFGNVLKDETSSTYGFRRKLCDTQEGKNTEIEFELPHGDLRIPKNCKRSGFTTHKSTVRDLLQWYGTEYRRKQDPDYWLKAMDQEIIKYEKSSIIIIPDVRFINEFNYIISKPNMFIFRIEPYKNYIYDKNSEHISEIQLDNYLHYFDEVFYPEYGKIHLKKIAHTIYRRYIYNKCRWLYDKYFTTRILREVKAIHF